MEVGGCCKCPPMRISWRYSVYDLFTAYKAELRGALERFTKSVNSGNSNRMAGNSI